MVKEMKALKKNETWELVPSPKRKNDIQNGVFQLNIKMIAQ